MGVYFVAEVIGIFTTLIFLIKTSNLAIEYYDIIFNDID